MTLIPGIKQISQVGNDMYAQGAISGAGIGTTEVSYLADPADTRLLAGRDPVLEEISVGMSGVETEQKYATGAQPLTVTDAMLGNLIYCQVQFSPKQDLNGYANPWPAGGGRNLCPMTATSGSGTNGLSITVNDDLTFYATKTGGAWGLITLGTATLKAGSYKIYEVSDNNTNAALNVMVDDTNIANTRYVKNGLSFSLTEDTEISVTYSRATETTSPVLVKAMIYPATDTDTSYSPYANLCPITGTDTVNVYVAPAYDPAAAPEATVSLGAERYGGTADLVSGIGSEIVKCITLTGANGETWGNYNPTYKGFAITLNDANINGIPADQLMSNQFKGCSVRGTPVNWEDNLMLTYGSTSDNKWVFFETTITDKNEWLAWLSNNPVQLSYPLALPTTFTFPGANDITLQEGTNTIWSDTNGTDISVTYVTKK